MEFSRREYFISRILANYMKVRVDNKEFKIYSPSADLVYEANELTQELSNEISDIFDDNDLYYILLERGLWTEEEENNLTKVLPDNLEKLKVGLYESLFQSKKQVSIRKYIKATIKEHDRLHGKRHFYDYVTRDGYLSYVKNQFLVSHTTRFDGKAVDWSGTDISKVLIEYHRKSLSPDTLRELARTSPWIFYWPTFKANGKIFDSPYLNLDQQQLIQWSLMYDNAHESMDCPPEKVFDDDDMFDGWLIVQKRKREAERNKSQVEDKTKGLKGDEVFVMADTFEDAKAIDSLNDPSVRATKQSRINQIQKHGRMREQDFTDVKLEAMMERNRAYVQKSKKGGR